MEVHLPAKSVPLVKGSSLRRSLAMVGTIPLERATDMKRTRRSKPASSFRLIASLLIAKEMAPGSVLSVTYEVLEAGDPLARIEPLRALQIDPQPAHERCQCFRQLGEFLRLTGGLSDLSAKRLGRIPVCILDGPHIDHNLVINLKNFEESLIVL